MRKYRQRRPKTTLPTLKDGLEVLARGIFAIPAILQQGDHWYLTRDESREIATQAESALSSLPSRKLERITKVVNTFGPWVALVTVLVVCTIARVQETRRLYALHATPRGPHPGPGFTDASPTDRGAVPENGAAAGSGPTKNRVADILRESEE